MCLARGGCLSFRFYFFLPLLNALQLAQLAFANAQQSAGQTPDHASGSGAPLDVPDTVIAPAHHRRVRRLAAHVTSRREACELCIRRTSALQFVELFVHGLVCRREVSLLCRSDDVCSFVGTGAAVFACWFAHANCFARSRLCSPAHTPVRHSPAQSLRASTAVPTSVGSLAPSLAAALAAQSPQSTSRSTASNGSSGSGGSNAAAGGDASALATQRSSASGVGVVTPLSLPRTTAAVNASGTVSRAGSFYGSIGSGSSSTRRDVVSFAGFCYRSFVAVVAHLLKSFLCCCFAC